MIARRTARSHACPNPCLRSHSPATATPAPVHAPRSWASPSSTTSAARTVSINRSLPVSSVVTPIVLLLVITSFIARPLAAQQDDANDTDTPSVDTPSVDTPSADALPEGVLATVNGRPVLERALESVYRQLTAREGGQDSGSIPDRESVVAELVDMEILTQEAERLSLDQLPDIAAALQLQYTRTMANALLSTLGEEMSFSEAELRAEYTRQMANLDSEEYRASHILLESEEAAREVIAELADGADFAALAAARSSDPAGQSNGGDLGWFRADSMIAEFVAAVEPMTVGETSAVPVRSDFGYHVILLSDRRGAAQPDFESVRAGLSELLRRERLAERVEALRQSADVVRRP